MYRNIDNGYKIIGNRQKVIDNRQKTIDIWNNFGKAGKKPEKDIEAWLFWLNTEN